MEMSGYEYHCAGGETFDSAALEIYGDEKYAAELLCANPAYSGKSVFSGDEILEIPVVEGTEETEGGYLPAAAPWKE